MLSSDFVDMAMYVFRSDILFKVLHWLRWLPIERRFFNVCNALGIVVQSRTLGQFTWISCRVRCPAGFCPCTIHVHEEARSSTRSCQVLNIKISSRQCDIWWALRVFPGGNQVDGLPPAPSTDARDIGAAISPVIVWDRSMVVLVFLCRCLSDRHGTFVNQRYQ